MNKKEMDIELDRAITAFLDATASSSDEALADMIEVFDRWRLRDDSAVLFGDREE